MKTYEQYIIEKAIDKTKDEITKRLIASLKTLDDIKSDNNKDKVKEIKSKIDALCNYKKNNKGEYEITQLKNINGDPNGKNRESIEIESAIKELKPASNTEPEKLEKKVVSSKYVKELTKNIKDINFEDLDKLFLELVSDDMKKDPDNVEYLSSTIFTIGAILLKHNKVKDEDIIKHIDNIIKA